MSQINQLFFQDIVGFLTENLTIKIDQLQLLDKIAKSYYTYIIYLDKLVDNEIPIDSINSNNNPLFLLTEHHELCINTIKELYNQNQNIVFLSKSKYSKIYFDALYIEKKFDFDHSKLTLENFEKLAIEKHIPVYFIVDAIQVLFPSYPSNEIKDMLAAIFKGIQMYDDLTDIGEDLQNKQFTYIISKTINYLKADNDYHPEDQSYTHKAFFALEELCNPEFEYMITQFEYAKKMANELEFKKIVSWSETILMQINEWKLQIDLIRNGE